ncbi:DUF4359 domain-containing protein [Flavobacterium sp. EDS]|uniref:DUF4359 domain-containing protein n=1 Tax=Flavobacterium sp. EDS TaxID=2897328 RepID=UPI001E3E601A|nr:DUF4359 domain-containing protein [Flavobacterium sp. EDS]MCD0476696.1 DUF4359 domain-containing protein [Flavobacterium sp. EDS]
MKTKHFIVIGISIILLIAIITNPDTNRHKEEVKSKIHEYLQNSLANDVNEADDKWSKASKLFGNLLGETMINNMVNTMITSNNYILFSTTNATSEGKTKTIGLGIFGNVFLSNKVNEAFKNSSKQNNETI